VIANQSFQCSHQFSICCKHLSICRPDGLELTTDWVSRSVCQFWCF